MNCSQALNFVLLGLSSDLEKWQLLFSIFLTLYLLGLLGNLILLLAIRVDVHLHTPMYFFLSQLSFVDLCLITTTAPKMLETLWTLYFFAVFADMDNLLLAVMAIARYAAVCHPLHYPLLMTSGRCGVLVSGLWGVAHCVSLVHTCCCPSYLSILIKRYLIFFCGFGSLLWLSCSDAQLNEGLMMIWLGALLCIVSSYGCIFHAVARVPSAQGKKKVLATCGSHFSMVTLFYSTVFATYLKPPTSSHSSGGLVDAVMYTLVTPALDPFIYSLRNTEVKSSLRKVLCMKKSQD
uniref:G-protein coupled receptors family 1 profile domain-containing protein n=1 Tax=Nannospalax galili TaxID=1026970 RepID=A0A8C6QRD0_NANGA